MFPVTVTLHDAAQLTAVMAALGANAVSFDETTPAPKAKPEKAKVEKAEPAEKVEAPKPETAAAATPPAPAAAQTASSGAGMTEADLTKVIVAAVARTSREQVLGLLNDKFSVTAGKQITDPAVREQAKQALEAL